MATTLARRKMCVIPEGTAWCQYSDHMSRRHGVKRSELTVPIIMQISQLIAPLRDDPQSIFQKRHYDQEPPDGWQIWLDRVRDGIQPVLNLTRLLSNRIERRRIVCSI